jgi:prephenate dehydrogenase
MARVHFQNPRTYAEIMSTSGAGRLIVKSFADNLLKIIELAEESRIEQLSELIEQNRNYLTDDFLKASMKQALEVDKTLSKNG